MSKYGVYVFLYFFTFYTPYCSSISQNKPGRHKIPFVVMRHMCLKNELYEFENNHTSFHMNYKTISCILLLIHTQIQISWSTTIVRNVYTYDLYIYRIYTTCTFKFDLVTGQAFYCHFPFCDEWCSAHYTPNSVQWYQHKYQ